MSEEEAKAAKPSWIKMKPEELEKLVISLAKEGKSPAQIGLVLRDKHGIPKVKLFGKKIKKILDEHNVKYKTEKEEVQAKIETVRVHSAKHKHDHTASRALTKKLWKMYRIDREAAR